MQIENYNKASIRFIDWLLGSWINNTISAAEFNIVFSCDSSSISRNVGLSVGLSASNEFYRSVMLLVVYLYC